MERHAKIDDGEEHQEEDGQHKGKLHQRLPTFPFPFAFASGDALKDG
jgi:hypothetical protein